MYHLQTLISDLKISSALKSRKLKVSSALTLYILGYFYTLFVPGGGANLPPYPKTDW